MDEAAQRGRSRAEEEGGGGEEGAQVLRPLGQRREHQAVQAPPRSHRRPQAEAARSRRIVQSPSGVPAYRGGGELITSINRNSIKLNSFQHLFPRVLCTWKLSPYWLVCGID